MFLNIAYYDGMYKDTQCADEKSNESVDDMDGTFAGW